MAARHGSTERPLLADEVDLANELLERPWAHASGERLPLGRRLEEGLGSGAGDATCWHAASLGRPISASATCKA